MSTEQTHPSHTVEGPWDVDWRNYDDDQDQIGDGLLRKKKNRLLARRKDISVREAAHRRKYGDAEIDDAEVL